MLLCRAGMLTLPVFSPDLSQIRVSRSLVFCAVFCRLVLLSFFLFLLYCLSFFDVWLLVAPFEIHVAQALYSV